MSKNQKEQVLELLKQEYGRKTDALRARFRKDIERHEAAVAGARQAAEKSVLASLSKWASGHKVRLGTIQVGWTNEAFRHPQLRLAESDVRPVLLARKALARVCEKRNTLANDLYAAYERIQRKIILHGVTPEIVALLEAYSDCEQES